MKYYSTTRIRQNIYFLSLVVLISLNINNYASAQNRELNIPEVQYTELEDYYSTGAEIACTARVYSNGLIDQLCSIYYEIYKDDFDTPITSVGTYGSISYTVRSQGSSHITEDITNGSGYLSVKPLFTTYSAFTLGIFDNYCVSRNRPVALSMVFNEPGLYRFNAEIQSCTNSGSNLFTTFTANGAEGCDTDVHKDYAASSCDSPASLFSDDIFITICDQNSISFLSGNTEYCPSEELNLVYSIGADDDAVDLSLLPNWIITSVDNTANTLTLGGTVPPYVAENSTISFDVRSLCSYNPESCPGAVINQTITIKNTLTPVLNGSNFTCVGESVNIGSDVAGTWYNSNAEIISIEQTAPDNEVVITAISAGSAVVNCEISDNGCQVLSEDFIFTVNPDYEINIIDAICEGDVYIFGEDELYADGEYTLNTTSIFDCDSVVHLDLSVLPIVEHEFSETGQTYTWNETTYTESGDYTQTFLAANGCDSIVTLHLTIITDIAYMNVNGNFTIFPNPANSVVFVDAISLKDQIVTVNVTDISGKILIEQHKLATDNSISIAELSDGIYFLNVFLDDKLVVTKMINKSR